MALTGNEPVSAANLKAALGALGGGWLARLMRGCGMWVAGTGEYDGDRGVRLVAPEGFSLSDFSMVRGEVTVWASPFSVNTASFGNCICTIPAQAIHAESGGYLYVLQSSIRKGYEKASFSAVSAEWGGEDSSISFLFPFGFNSLPENVVSISCEFRR